MATLKYAALDRAREIAGRRAEELGIAPDSKEALPTMSDYLQACLEPEMIKKAAEAGVQWNARSFTNFDGMDIKGFAFNRDDIYPSDATRAQMQAAIESAQQSLQKLDPATRESLKMDDLTVDKFYRDVQTCISFDDSKFYNVHFHPTHSFEEFVEGKAAVVKDCVFDGITTNNHVKLTGGELINNKVTNISHGTIEIGDNTKVDGLDLSGVTANLMIGAHAVVERLTTDESTHIVKLEVGEGAVLAHAEFNGTQISPGSHLKGATLNDVHFEKGAVLRDVDFRGVTLNNVTINGQPASLDLLKSMGAEVDEKTTRITHAPDAVIGLTHAALDTSARSLKFDLPELKQKDISELPSPNLADLVAAISRGLSSAVTGVQEADTTQITQTRDVADMEKPAHLIREGGMAPGQRQKA